MSQPPIENEAHDRRQAPSSTCFAAALLCAGRHRKPGQSAALCGRGALATCTDLPAEHMSTRSDFG
jgi:hypothetical protein